MSAQWSKVSTADNDLMAQYSALSKPRFSKSAGAVLGKGSYDKLAMKGLGRSNYTRAALRGLGRENYTRAALRGLGRENYTRAAMRGMGGKRTCSGGFSLNPKGWFKKIKDFLTENVPGLGDGVMNVIKTVVPKAGGKLLNLTFTILKNSIDGKQQTDAEITKKYADLVIEVGKETFEESRKEIEKQLSAPKPEPKPEPEPMDVDQEPRKTGPPKKPLPIPGEKPSENPEEVPTKIPKTPSSKKKGSTGRENNGRGLVPNFKNYDEFEAYLNSI